MGRGARVLVRDAKDAARQWVLEEASRDPRVDGAFFLGSISALPDDAVLPAGSDVDVRILLDQSDVAGLPHKHLFRGVVLDVAYAPRAEVQSPETVLSTYYTAVHFLRPGIILDPTGHLRALQPIVAREYARRRWVRRRCAQAREQFLASLTRLDPTAPLHDQVFAWLFALLMATHPILVADLRNPTVRRCLAVLGEVLAAYGRPSLHERVLGILGSAAMDRGQVEILLAACAGAFDAAAAVRRTPFPYASNISAFARALAIGGTQEVIAAGFHREAVFWIAAIHNWSQTALYHDASAEVQARFTPVYERLLTALGVPSVAALGERMEHLRRLAPDLWRVTEEIVATNPAIRD